MGKGAGYIGPLSIVVYADDRLFAIDKGPGVSLATPRSDPEAAVRRLVASVASWPEGWTKPEASGLRLVHRLDVATTGLVLIAREAEAHQALVRAFSERRVEKSYLALVWGHPRPRRGSYDWPVAPDPRDRRRMRTAPSGSPAVTRYETLAAARHASLVLLRPETGRTHQLRVHLARAGHWIVGDDLYCGPRHRAVRERELRSLLDPPHLLLHAWRLAVPELAGMPARRFEAGLPPAFGASLSGLGIVCREVPWSGASTASSGGAASGG